jgi:hypothetical protein
MKRIVLVVGITLSVASGALAQGCSVCTKTAQGLDDKSAKGLNGGILYLALLPLAIMGTVGYMWLRSKNSN